MVERFVWLGEKPRCKNSIYSNLSNKEGWHSLTYGEYNAVVELKKIGIVGSPNKYYDNAIK